MNFSAGDPLLSIVIPVGNDSEGLSITLASLKGQVTGQPFQVLVVNDGTFAGISETCQAFAFVTEIALNPSLGAYGARNAAILASRSPRLAFVDANIEVSPGWCRRGIEALEKADYVGGPVEFPLPSRPTLTEWVQILSEFRIERFMDKCHFAATANLFVRRQVFEELGLFEERLKSSGDLEWGDRVYRSQRFIQKFDPSIPVIHPLRDHLEMIRKLHRLCRGRRRLAELYPDRFPDLKLTPRKLGALLFPPRMWILDDLKHLPGPGQKPGYYFCRWYYRLAECYFLLASTSDYIDPPQKIHSR